MFMALSITVMMGCVEEFEANITDMPTEGLVVEGDIISDSTVVFQLSKTLPLDISGENEDLFDTFQDGLVVLDCQIPRFIDGRGIRLLHLFLIGHMDLGLVLLVIAGADDGIEGDAKSQQEGDDGNGNGQNFSFRDDPPFKMGAKIEPRRVLRLSGARDGSAYCWTVCFSFFLKVIN